MSDQPTLRYNENHGKGDGYLDDVLHFIDLGVLVSVEPVGMLTVIDDYWRDYFYSKGAEDLPAGRYEIVPLEADDE